MQGFGKPAAGGVSMLKAISFCGRWGVTLLPFHFSDRNWARCQEEMDPF